MRRDACEIFKGEKINLLLSHLKTHVSITYLNQSSFFVHLMVSPGLESEQIVRSGSVTSTIRGRNSEISVDMKLDTVVF